VHDHHAAPVGDVDGPTVALAGAPNVGKSVLFNRLAETYADVSNYPGTTLDTSVARWGDGLLVDAPGVYGVSDFNEEERIARDVILAADVVCNVVDATRLDRDLFLTLQLLDLGRPTLVVLNLVDEAERDGITIDVDELEQRLGVPVVPTVAVTGRGVADVERRLVEATAPAETPVARWFDHLPADLAATRAERVLLVEADRPTAERLLDGPVAVADGGVATGSGLRDAVYADRRRRIGELTRAVVSTADRPRTLADVASDLLMRPLTGTPLVLLTLGLVYLVIGNLVAQRLVDFLEVVVFGRYYVPFVRTAVTSTLPTGGPFGFVSFLLVNGNLGLLTVTVQYVLAVLLPLVLAFYLVIGLLEDSGVLPRLAVLADRGLTHLGLNGRAVVPLIVGVGCVTMAVITTRMVGSRRERLIATALLGLAIPCSAQLGVILGLLAGLGLAWWFAYLAVIVTVFGVAGVFLDAVLPGESEALIAELPRLRVPRPGNLLRKTVGRTRMFLLEAGPLFAVTAVGVSSLDYVGGLDLLVRGLAPLSRLVGLPPSFGRVLVLGVVRRDFAAAGMTALALTPGQTFVGLVVVTLFVPCILSMVVIAEERDVRTGVVMWLGSWLVAFAVGAVLAAVVL